MITMRDAGRLANIERAGVDNAVAGDSETFRVWEEYWDGDILRRRLTEKVEIPCQPLDPSWRAREAGSARGPVPRPKTPPPCTDWSGTFRADVNRRQLEKKREQIAREIFGDILRIRREAIQRIAARRREHRDLDY